MASPVRTYQTQMHSNLGFYATWLPTDPVSVGDVGILEGGRFRKVTSLQELAIAPTVKRSAGQGDLQFSSTEGVKLDTSGSGKAAGVGKLEVAIQFSGEGAFLFHASGLQLQRLENRAQIAQAVLDAYRAGRWKKDWLIVESVHAADCATVIISEDSSARLLLSADLKLPTPFTSLADPRVGFEVSVNEGKMFRTLSGKKLSPLYSCLRVKDPFFGAAEVLPVRGGEDATRLLSRPAIDELLES